MLGSVDPMEQKGLVPPALQIFPELTQRLRGGHQGVALERHPAAAIARAFGSKPLVLTLAVNVATLDACHDRRREGGAQPHHHRIVQHAQGRRIE